VRHALDAIVEPDRRLLVTNDQSPRGSDVSAAAHLGRLGVAVAGEAAAPDQSASTAWTESR
jgi:hypothetical protein